MEYEKGVADVVETRSHLSQADYTAEDDLERLVLFPPPPEHWEFKQVPPHPV